MDSKNSKYLMAISVFVVGTVVSGAYALLDIDIEKNIQLKYGKKLVDPVKEKCLNRK